jgi:RNA polymerase II C-terminal domain phosphatase-like 3/4
MTLHEEARPGGPELYDLRYMRMWTKLRPGARALLAGASPLAEIMVYTMGDRAYAVEMARLLDPGGSLLRRGRLIAAPDSRTSGLKDLDVVLGAASAVLILDDTPGVWRRHADNVITAERYHFFPCSPRGHGGDASQSWLANAADEDEADGVLAALLRVIQRVHAAFFDGSGGGGGGALANAPEQRDVRPLLRGLRSAVLRGCVLVFSRGARAPPACLCAPPAGRRSDAGLPHTAVIPLGAASPEQHALWRLAVELGATCATSVGDNVTHVVTGHAGTDKARWAAARGVFCVTPAWLKACGARWERAHEAGFAVAATAAAATASAAAAAAGAQDGMGV